MAAELGGSLASFGRCSGTRSVLLSPVRVGALGRRRGLSGATDLAAFMWGDRRRGYSGHSSCRQQKSNHLCFLFHLPRAAASNRGSKVARQQMVTAAEGRSHGWARGDVVVPWTWVTGGQNRAQQHSAKAREERLSSRIQCRGLWVDDTVAGEHHRTFSILQNN